MNRQEKQREVFTKLVNRQLLPFGKTYEEVANDPRWYLRYTVTPEQEKEFMAWGVQLLKEELKLNKRTAENEMSWFIMQWGLTTNPEALQNVEKAERKAKTTKSK